MKRLILMASAVVLCASLANANTLNITNHCHFSLTLRVQGTSDTCADIPILKRNATQNVSIDFYDSSRTCTFNVYRTYKNNELLGTLTAWASSSKGCNALVTPAVKDGKFGVTYSGQSCGPASDKTIWYNFGLKC